MLLGHYGLVGEMHSYPSPPLHPLDSRRRLMGFLFYFGEVGQDSEAQRVCPVQLMNITDE